METHEREQLRSRALQRRAEQAIPGRFDRWPAIRERALAVQAETTGRQPARWRGRLTHGLGPALVAGTLVVALLAMLSQRPSRGQATSAHEILYRAQLAAAGTAASAASMNYHLTAVQRFGPNAALPDWAAGAQTVDVERWHAANGDLREQNDFRDAAGQLLLTQGAVRNSNGEWLYYSIDQQTDALYWSAAGAPSADGTPVLNAEDKAKLAGADGTPDAAAQSTADAAGVEAKLTAVANATPPADGTPIGAETQKTPQNGDATPDAGDEAVKQTVIASEQQASPPTGTGSDIAQLWSPGDTSNSASLEQLLSDLSRQGCGQAGRQADETVAGRAVYVISVVSDGSCLKLGASGQQLLVRVDQQTFVTLGWEQHAADGTLLGSFTVTSIDYDAQFPVGLFDYTPPGDASVCAADGSEQYPACQSKGPRSRPQATPTP